jgi:hypothetical protein
LGEKMPDGNPTGIARGIRMQLYICLQFCESLSLS